MGLNRGKHHFASNLISGVAALVAGTTLIPLSNPGAGLADAAPSVLSTPSSTSYGWSYAPVASLGQGETIAGMDPLDGHLTIYVRRVETFAEGGWKITNRYLAATWNPKTNTLSNPTKVNSVPSGYHGNIELNFPTLLPNRFQRQTVKVERVTKAGKSVVVKWPTSVPLYGSEQTPQTTVPGSLDNEILGQSGQWLWVALKGPQYPPNYPNSGPLVTGFRYWNRVVALNLKTGQYRIYSIPRSYASYQNIAEAPSMAQVNGTAFVGIGSWIGEFPANPAPTTNSGTASNVIDPILHPAPPSIISQNGQEALASFRQLYWQVVNGLAAYWDSVMGKRVPGMPQYQNGDGPGTWNTMFTVNGHGDLPGSLVWAMEYPFEAGSKENAQRNRLEESLLSLLRTKLNGAASSAIPTTYATVRKSFGGKPPMSLPGYTIRDNLYWPNSQSVLARGAAPLPADFPTYTSVEDSLGPLLSTRSAATVLLPVLPPAYGWERGGTAESAAMGGAVIPPTRLLNPPHGSYLDVQYQVNQGQVPNGYSITVSIGPKAVANSPKLDPGNAETLYAMAGVPQGTALPKGFQWPASAAIRGGHPSRVSLGHGVVATVWSGMYNGVHAKGVSWKQDGLTWIIPPSAWSSVNPVKDARTEVSQLARLQMPSGATGYGIFGYGSDMPSQVVLHDDSSTYVLYSTGWRVAEMAALMSYAP